MAIKIKPNTSMIEAREEIVQIICDTFVNNLADETKGVLVSSNYGEIMPIGIDTSGNHIFCNEDTIDLQKNEDLIYPTTTEIRMAFRELIKAGYFMFRLPEPLVDEDTCRLIAERDRDKNEHHEIYYICSDKPMAKWGLNEYITPTYYFEENTDICFINNL